MLYRAITITGPVFRGVFAKDQVPSGLHHFACGLRREYRPSVTTGKPLGGFLPAVAETNWSTLTPLERAQVTMDWTCNRKECAAVSAATIRFFDRVRSVLYVFCFAPSIRRVLSAHVVHLFTDNKAEQRSDGLSVRQFLF